MRNLALATLGLSLLACPSPPPQDRGALRVDVKLASKLPATCVLVEVLGAEGTPQASTRVERTAAQAELRVGIFRGELPESVRVRAQALYGAGCGETPYPLSTSDTVEASFTPGQVMTRVLELPMPPASEDADGDGFRSTDRGGPDCNDNNDKAFPRAAEACDGSADLNCNGELGCDDAACSGQACTVVASRLSFTSAPSQAAAGACAGPFTLERRSPKGLAATQGTVQATLGAEPLTGVAFHSDANCTQIISQVTVPDGASSASFHLRSTRAGALQVSATASGLTGDARALTVRPGAVASLTFSLSNSAPLLLGDCIGPVSARLQDTYGNPVPMEADTPLSGVSTPLQGVTLYTDGACTQALANPTVANGASQAQFHLKPTASGNVSFSLTGPNSTLDSRSFTVLPNVRRGDCTLNTGSTSTTCAISPPLGTVSRGFVVFQSTSTSNLPSTYFVRCRITDAATLTCSRNNATLAASIHWQVVESPQVTRALSVEATCAQARTSKTLAQAVDPARSFVLYASQQDGDFANTNDFATVELPNPTQVDVTLSPTPCVTNATYGLQVVEWPGLEVTRGTTGALSGGTRLDVGSLSSVDLSRAALLFSYRATTSTEAVCDRMVRGFMPSATELRFVRGNGSTSSACTAATVDAISWQRLQFPPGALVQEVTATLASGSSSTALLLPQAVAPERTFVFASNQVLGGASGGETAWATTTTDALPVASARLELVDSTQLRVSRSTTQDASRWTVYVVQLPP